jgi:RNA polymerase sigma-70 factor (ECF subfamily)
MSVAVLSLARHGIIVGLPKCNQPSRLMTFSARHHPIVPPHDEHAAEHRDAELLARARTGDPAAFEALFHAYYDRLCRLVDRYVRSAETAEEVVQSLFLRLWEQRETWTVRDTVRVYLYSAARRRALDHLKHERVTRRFREAAVADPSLLGEDASAPSVVDRLETADRANRVRDAIDGLPDRYRTVLVLRIEHQLTVPAIAGILGIPIKTAETRAARALKLLKRLL